MAVAVETKRRWARRALRSAHSSTNRASPPSVVGSESRTTGQYFVLRPKHAKLRRFVGLFVIAAASCHSRLGAAQDLPAIDHLQPWQLAIQRQQNVIDELTQLGAKCEASLYKAPYVRIAIGRQWRGGAATGVLLRKLERVDELTLTGDQIGDAILKRVVSLPELTIVRIDDAAITPSGLAQLRRAKNLFGLQLRNVDLTGSAWSSICGLNLCWLNVQSDDAPFGEDNPQPGQFGRLLSLRMSGKRVSDDTLARIVRLEQIRDLVLNNTPVTDAGLDQLIRLATLSHLDLSGTNVRGPGLEALAKLHFLKSLELNHTSVSDDALAHCARIKSLESLALDSTSVTDEGVARLADMENLRTISLVDTRTTTLCFRSLCRIKTLISVIDHEGNVTLFRPSWLKSRPGQRLPHWVDSRSKKLFLWTETGRQLYRALDDVRHK